MDGLQNDKFLELKTRHFGAGLLWYTVGSSNSSTQRGIKTDGFKNGKFFETWHFCARLFWYLFGFLQWLHTCPVTLHSLALHVSHQISWGLFQS